MKQKIFLSMSRVNSQQINNYFLSGTGQSSAMKFVLNCLLVLPKKKKGSCSLCPALRCSHLDFSCLETNLTEGSVQHSIGSRRRGPAFYRRDVERCCVTLVWEPDGYVVRFLTRGISGATELFLEPRGGK